MRLNGWGRPCPRQGSRTRLLTGCLACPTSAVGLIDDAQRFAAEDSVRRAQDEASAKRNGAPWLPDWHGELVSLLRHAGLPQLPLYTNLGLRKTLRDRISGLPVGADEQGSKRVYRRVGTIWAIKCVEPDHDSRAGVRRSYLGLDEASVLGIGNSGGHITGSRLTQGTGYMADEWRPRIVRLVAALTLNHPDESVSVLRSERDW